jgi:hypothetical protein
MLRLLLLPFVLIAFLASCQQNHLTKKEVKLVSPKNDETAPADSIILKNCIVIGKSNYSVFNEGKTDTINDLEGLTKYFQANQKQLNRRRLHILFDSSTAPRVIVDVLDLITEYRIDDYYLINTQEPKDSPPSISKETSQELREKDVDSSYFCIRITRNNFELSILNKKATAKNTEDIEAFIEDNRALINREKVVLTGKADLNYPEFKPILEAFRKYSIYKYALVPL